MEIFYSYDVYLQLQKTRKRPTECELILAGALLQAGIDYRMQVQISETTVDGLIEHYFAPAKIIIEVDGSYHDSREQRMIDIRRMVLHSKMGYHTIRVRNEGIQEDVETVVKKIMGIGCFLESLTVDNTMWKSMYNNN